ncbi:MAG: phosphatase PAP2 family protein [Bacteriovorax sp.]|nr:phosphatase PAP2 family protein [Bacteriovorax sp.]
MKSLVSSFAFVSLIFCISTSKASDLDGATYWNGLKTSFGYLYQGSYLQFQEKNNLYYAAVAAPALWFSFDQDKRISDNARSKAIPKLIQLSGDMAPLLGLPLISFATFTYGIKHDDKKLVQFAQECFGAMYLAFIESAALSVINIHERPSTAKLSKIETDLRGKSSFPSGHVIPFATLAFKTFQFYGPLWAIAPAGLMVMTSIQRVRDGKHYLSDVVGGFFLSAFASEGVRKAGNFEGNHPDYKFLFERNMTVGIIEHEGRIGPRLTFDWN